MQGVLVFASAAARDAAITSPQEGQCCYLKDTDAVLTYSGAAWVGFDDSNAIQNSIVDAKGDIVAASAADTPARLAVGSNGETLVADSSTSTGLRYTAGTVQANPVLNSAFQVWQRGTSIAYTASTYVYTADRFMLDSSNTCTVSRQATGDTTNLPFIQYCARVQRNSGQTSLGNLNLNQSFESINAIPFVGKTVTFSFYARAGANFSATSNLFYGQLLSGTGTDQNPRSGSYTGQATVGTATATLTTSWQRFTVTGTVSSAATELALVFFYTPTGTASTNDYYELTGVQLDIGSVALPFRTYAGTIQGELAACQRYYWRSSKMEAFGHHGIGIGKNGTSAMIDIKLPVTMRVKPTSIDFNAVAAYDTSSVLSATAVNFQSTQGTADQVALDVVFASGGTQFRPYFLIANNDTNGYIGLSAEL
jgi:hypothetical protein